MFAGTQPKRDTPRVGRASRVGAAAKIAPIAVLLPHGSEGESEHAGILLGRDPVLVEPAADHRQLVERRDQLAPRVGVADVERTGVCFLRCADVVNDD